LKSKDNYLEDSIQKEMYFFFAKKMIASVQ